MAKPTSAAAPSDAAQAAIARRGRPSDGAKHAAILAAAQAQFMDVGFAATTMERIAEAANVSKLTVYRHFGSKDALFAAAVAHKSRTMLEGMGDATFGHSSARAVLESVGRSFLSLILHPDALAIHQVIIGERHRSPDLGRIFFDSAVTLTQARVAAQIERLILRGALAGDAVTIAGDLLALLQSRPLMHLELGVDVLDAAALDAHLRHVVAVVLRAYAPDTAAVPLPD
jgi:TetR/AcrR family transcriptional repressor of mexJK operon